MHWGSNWGWRPTRGIQRLARCLVDAGADLVFGTSAHHIQGIQVYRGRAIIFGAGAAAGAGSAGRGCAAAAKSLRPRARPGLLTAALLPTARLRPPAS